MNAVFITYSNLTVINAIAVKMKYFPDDDCDMIMWGTLGTSNELLSAVNSTRVFRRIIVVDNLYNTTNAQYHQLKGLKKLTGLKLYDRANQQYQEMINGIPTSTYDLCLLTYASNINLPIVSALIKRFPKIRVRFIDEGFFVYGRGIDSLTSTLHPEESKQKALWRDYFEKGPIQEVVAHSDRVAYLRMPDYPFGDTKGYSFEPIPSFSDIPQYKDIEDKLLVVTPEEVSEKYRNARMIYIAQAMYAESKRNIILDQCVIQSMIGSTGGRHAIIKVHPNYDAHAKKAYSYMENDCHIDRDTHQFEVTLSRLEHIDKMTLVTINSSVIANPKLWYDKEPYIIVVLKLFKAKNSKECLSMGKMIDYLRGRYSRPEKIFYPDTFEEYEKNLSQINAETGYLPDDE